MADTGTRLVVVEMGSERGFGIVFAVVFTIVFAWPLKDGMAPNWWALVVAAVFLGLAFLWPRALRPLNIVWFAFGRVLHRIMGPVVLAILFFTTLTPTAWLLRLFGKDPLRLARKAPGESYWVSREDDGPGSFRNQF